jgi:rRNA-processing protein FCF1
LEALVTGKELIKKLEELTKIGDLEICLEEFDGERCINLASPIDEIVLETVSRYNVIVGKYDPSLSIDRTVAVLR